MLGHFPTAHVFWVALEKTSYGVLVNQLGIPLSKRASSQGVMHLRYKNVLVATWVRTKIKEMVHCPQGGRALAGSSAASFAFVPMHLKARRKAIRLWTVKNVTVVSIKKMFEMISMFYRSYPQWFFWLYLGDEAEWSVFFTKGVAVRLPHLFWGWQYVRW